MRTRPAPSAPAARAARASATEPRLAATTNVVAVAGHRRLLGQRELPARAARQPRRRAVRTPSTQLRRRVDVQLAGAAVEDDRGALGDVEHLGAGSDDHGDAPRPGQDRRVRRRAPLGQDHAGHQVQVEAGGLGGRQVGGDQDPCGGHPPSGLAGQRAQHLVADGADVGGPLAQVGVGQRGPAVARRRRGSPPTRRRPRRPSPMRALTSASISASASSERWASKMLACSAPTSRAVSGPDAARSRDAPRRPPRRCVATRPPARPRGWSSRSRAAGAQPADRADRDARRRRQRPVSRATARRRRGCGRRARRSRRTCASPARARARPPPAPAAPMARTSTSWPRSAAERRDPAEAAGRDRPGTGGQVAQLDRRVERPHLADQPGRGPGVQAVRVLDREDADDAPVPPGVRVRRPARAPASPGARPCRAARRAPRPRPRPGWRRRPRPRPRR